MRIVFTSLLCALLVNNILRGQSNPSVTVQNYAGLTINGSLGESYTVQYEATLASQTEWITITNVVLTTNPFLWVDITTPESGTSSRYYRVIPTSQTSASAPTGMVLIPAGSFVMGDALDGESDASTNTEYISAFYMDSTLVSYSLWETVHNWAVNNGYSFDNAGSSTGSSDPVQSIDWFDAIKWCNARSQMNGVEPVYYSDTGFTKVFKTGVEAPYANWSAPGYRLPSEAEWEKAARGGLVKQRFVFGNTIAQSQANYYGDPANFRYDLGPAGYNPAFGNGLGVDTSAVTYFPANGYGLHDMEGNLFQWCWDWYGPYVAGVQTNPHGPTQGSFRVLRGGSWLVTAYDCRVANRNYYYATLGGDGYGFRTVLMPASQ